MNIVKLTDEEINDILIFLNRVNIGNQNAIGEAKSFYNIINAIENSTKEENENG